ncbi:hypothetical protein G3O08_17900 [Cryomorpha ignava]|uniref:HipA-like kinase domain-containing protein n=1 Tax=Cryomorpha ignava TaxID=101383 RepID=A0A7K3WUM1_9FLAO|nr:HipA family kinase [Cryomorpha ignava]NEN25373.1 hypothetical protein [Cryomorpha ignava]
MQILCNDPSMKLWIVKSSRNEMPAYRLIKELIAYRFAELWAIKQPIAALIEVNPEHLKALDIDPTPYSIPCFGSQWRPHRLDWDKFMAFSDKPFIKNFDGFEDLLKIALFDLWTGNEDRFAENHNLLIESSNRRTAILAIDHEAILNSSNSNHNVIYTDSKMMLPETYFNLLSSNSIEHVLSQFKEKRQYCKFLVQEFPNLIEKCSANLKSIFEEIPTEWGINSDEIFEYVQRELFKDSWIETVSEQFTTLASRLK